MSVITQIILNNRIKNVVLNKTFRGDFGMTIEAFENDVSVSDRYDFLFSQASDGVIVANRVVDIAVTPNEVNYLRLYLKTSNEESLLTKIELEEDEIKDFGDQLTGGIYRLNTFELRL